MTSHPLTLREHTLLQRSAACPRRSTFETAAGSLILHNFCAPSLVASLKADRGLHAFARVPEREHQLLLGIAEHSDCALTLAYTPIGEIIVGVDPDPANNERMIQWARDYWMALHPYSAGGGYVNMMMDEGTDTVKAAYRDNYARLAQIKATYDPSNLFHVNQNIKPTR
jgi:hypothetical protein